MPSLDITDIPPSMMWRGSYVPSLTALISQDDMEVDAPALWVLVVCKGRCERAVMRELRDAGRMWDRPLGFFEPLVPGTVRSGGTVWPTFRPLFPGYLFAWCTAYEHAWLRSCRHVRGILRVAASDQSNVTDSLQRVEKRVAAGVARPASIVPTRVGQSVVINEQNVFAGVRGRIAALGPKGAVRIVVPGTPLEYEVDVSCVDVTTLTPPSPRLSA